MRNINLALTLLSIVLPCCVHAEDDVFATRKIASKKEAVILSALFPGLGQLSAGRQVVGTILLISEIGSLATALTANENYKTRLDNFERIKSEYEQMAAGNSERDLAQQKWDELRKDADDLDDLHRLRRAFTAAAVGVYIYSLADILLGDAPEASSASAWDLKIVPGLGNEPARLMVTGSF